MEIQYTMKNWMAALLSYTKGILHLPAPSVSSLSQAKLPPDVVVYIFAKFVGILQPHRYGHIVVEERAYQYPSDVIGIDLFS
jgi:hypothetical protein